MKNISLNQATGLTPTELAEVFQTNPRAYMAVRGAVAEKHLEKILIKLLREKKIDNYRKASGDQDKDFYIQVNKKSVSLECKNVEVIKTSNQKSRINYLHFLQNEGYITTKHINQILEKLALADRSFHELNSSQLTKFFRLLPQNCRDSGLIKYQYSTSKIKCPSIGKLSDNKFIEQFDSDKITIDFQRTRNSTDEDGDNRRNRFYKKNEIDIVAACLFSRTLKWEFLFARAENFILHEDFPDRYSNKLKLTTGIWISNLCSLLSTKKI
ncbi:hypothetical protein [Gimesia maris]|uniref:hypothetical protein n=1 Tax=Gimesia maris TaxID=122 RepID=UPI003A915DF1